MTDIDKVLALHESLQELIDRRSNVLRDLKAIDEEIAAAYASIIQPPGAVESPKALPPKGGAASPRTSRRRSGSMYQKVLETMRSQRRGKQWDLDAIAMTAKVPRDKVSGVLWFLTKEGETERVTAGVYRLV